MGLGVGVLVPVLTSLVFQVFSCDWSFACIFSSWPLASFLFYGPGGWGLHTRECICWILGLLLWLELLLYFSSWPLASFLLNWPGGWGLCTCGCTSCRRMLKFGNLEMLTKSQDFNVFNILICWNLEIIAICQDFNMECWQDFNMFKMLNCSKDFKIRTPWSLKSWEENRFFAKSSRFQHVKISRLKIPNVSADRGKTRWARVGAG